MEPTHALDDGLQELAGRGVVGLLGDRDYPDAPLRSMDSNATACSLLRASRENFRTRISLTGALDLPASSVIPLNWGPVGYSSAFGLVCILTGDYLSVLSGVVAEGPQQRGHRRVHIPPITGQPGKECRR